MSDPPDDEKEQAELTAAAETSVRALRHLAAASAGVASARLRELHEQLAVRQRAGDARGADETAALIAKLEDASTRLAAAAGKLGT